MVRGGTEPSVTSARTQAPRDSATTGRSPGPSSAQSNQRGKLALRGESSDGAEPGRPAFIPDRPLTGKRNTRIADPRAPPHGQTPQERTEPVSIRPDHGPAPRAPRQRRNIGALSRSGRADQAPGALGQPPSSGTPLTGTACVTLCESHLINRGLAAHALCALLGHQRTQGPAPSPGSPAHGPQLCPALGSAKGGQASAGETHVLTDSVLWFGSELEANNPPASPTLGSKSRILGLPWRFSGEDPVPPMRRAWVQSLVRARRSLMARGTAYVTKVQALCHPGATGPRAGRQPETPISEIRSNTGMRRGHGAGARRNHWHARPGLARSLLQSGGSTSPGHHKHRTAASSCSAGRLCLLGPFTSAPHRDKASPPWPSLITPRLGWLSVSEALQTNTRVLKAGKQKRR